tara:strand:+ start:597 stop:1064 length:468 start_codon:yes stop_codon:yes gene_type:complete
MKVNKFIKRYNWIFLVLGVVLLCAYSYSYYNEHYPSLSSYLKDDVYEGRIAENCGKMGEKVEDGFELIYGKDKIFVKTDEEVKRPKWGFVCVLGEYSNGTILMRKYHSADYNNIKYGISFIALIIFAFIFFREWEIKGLRFKERFKGKLRGRKNA